MADYNEVVEVVDLDENMYAAILEMPPHRIMTITDSVTQLGLIQGRMLIKDPLVLCSKYMPLSLVGLQWFRQVRKITIMGLGVGAMPRYLKRSCPYAEITIVERYPQVIQLSDNHFFEGELLNAYNIVCIDYLDYLNDGWYPAQDILVVDVFTGSAKTGEMANADFYRLCRDHIGEQGVVTVNLISPDRRGLTRCFDSASGIFPYVYELGDGLPDQQRVLAASMTRPPKFTLLERQRYGSL